MRDLCGRSQLGGRNSLIYSCVLHKAVECVYDICFSSSLAPSATMPEHKHKHKQPADHVRTQPKQPADPVRTQPKVCVYPASYITDGGNSSYFRVSQGVAPMQIGGNRNAKNRAIKSDGKRRWSHGLCSCFGSSGTCT
jgi:hypothetical protein